MTRFSENPARNLVSGRIFMAAVITYAMLASTVGYDEVHPLKYSAVVERFRT